MRMNIKTWLAIVAITPIMDTVMTNPIPNVIVRIDV